MTDDNKRLDFSQEAVWKREIGELSENLKYPERYSDAEFRFMQSRKAELEKILADKNNKKNKFNNATKSVENKSAMIDMANAQSAAYRD